MGLTAAAMSGPNSRSATRVLTSFRPPRLDEVEARQVGTASVATEQGPQAMEIEGTTFGTITIDGKTYEHDVIIRLPAKS